MNCLSYRHLQYCYSDDFEKINFFAYTFPFLGIINLVFLLIVLFGYVQFGRKERMHNLLRVV